MKTISMVSQCVEQLCVGLTLATDWAFSLNGRSIEQFTLRQILNCVQWLLLQQKQIPSAFICILDAPARMLFVEARLCTYKGGLL